MDFLSPGVQESQSLQIKVSNSSIYWCTHMHVCGVCVCEGAKGKATYLHRLMLLSIPGKIVTLTTEKSNLQFKKVFYVTSKVNGYLFNFRW